MSPSVATDRASSAPLFVVASAIGVLAGLGSAGFLFVLDVVTRTRQANGWLLYALPFAGIAVGFVYERFGESIRGGTDLVIDAIHDAGPRIPLRMAPMVVIGTLLTHLFGGSAGREGTAVQMAASLADFVSHRLRPSAATRRVLLVSGVAAGFGSVFGTPIAGAVFGVEFVVVGRLETRALVPALLASFVGDATARAVGARHAVFPVVPQLALSPTVVAKWLVMALAVAATAAAFVELTHGIKARSKALLPSLPLRMALGGAVVVALTKLLGTERYLGLGVETILASFSGDGVLPQDFAWKALFTAVTVGCGFLGGEVTPLFFVGATLGCALGGALGLPLRLCAGVGMAATFGVAANTPLALSIMAVELLGGNVFPHVVLVAFGAFLLIGPRSIYASQRRDAIPHPEAPR